MKNRFAFVFIFILFSIAATCQKEGNVWHFGQSAALDFNNGAPQIIAPSAMWTLEGSASISDVNGNLLFYSNGGGRDPITSGQPAGKIWNRQHNVMYDMGFTEGGGFSAAQSSVIIPRPGVTGNYYLFTMEEVEFSVGGDVPGQPVGRGLSFFEVDMSLNGGLGGVVNYQGLAYTPTYEGLCAIRNSNGTDYWIIVHRNDNMGFAIFPVNGLGVGTPILFNTGFLTGGMIKASPDGKWITCLSDSGEQILCQFNAAAGTVSNIQILDAAPNFVEFSPNSKRLFMTIDNQVQYFDLTNPNINGSKIIVDDFPGFDFINGFNYIIGQMQLGPDGKIYMLRSDFTTDSTLLSTIACPNSSPYLEINTLGFYSDTTHTFLGLPNFDNGIFKRDDDVFAIDLGPNRSLCNGAALTLDAGAGGNTYNWSNGSSGQTLEVSTSGFYTVTVSSGCGTGVDSTRIDAVQVSAKAGNDTTICRNSPLQLQGSGSGQLSWSPAGVVNNASSATPIFTGQSTTTLAITATTNGCSESDSITITVQSLPDAMAIPADTAIVQGNSVMVTGSGGIINWAPSTGLSCTDCANPVATPETTTTYVLTVTNPAGCSDTAQVIVRVSPPDCEARIPNAFSPNGDMNNDDFKPIGQVQSYELSIFNRWGDKIYEGNTPWDGKSQSEPAPVDVYFYRTTVKICGEDRAYSGQVTLIR